MRAPSTFGGLMLILLVSAVLPLSALAFLVAGEMEEQAQASDTAQREAMVLEHAVRLARARADEPGAAPERGFELTADGARHTPDGPASPDPVLAGRVGQTVRGTIEHDGAWVSWARIPREDAVLVQTYGTAPGDARGMWALPALGLALGGITLFAAGLTRVWVARPLHQVAHAAERMREGDLDARAEAAGTAEVRSLAASFNAMAQRLAEKTRALERASARLAAHSRARTSQLQEAVTQLREFSFTVEHELREPLRSIETLIDQMLRDSRERVDPHEMRVLLTLVQRRTHRLERVAGALRAYDALAMTEPAVEDVDLRDVFDEAAAELAALAQRTVDVAVEGPLPRVRGDRDALVLLFVELLVNGATFNARDVPKVRVRVLDPERVCLAFDDDGVGIPPGRREDALQLFKRLHPPERFGGGMGVGLALARRVVEMHEGDLELDASPEGGTRVLVTLPPGGPAKRPPLPKPRYERRF